MDDDDQCMKMKRGSIFKKKIKRFDDFKICLMEDV